MIRRLYWAEFANEALNAAQDCEYLLIAHDDVVLLTSEFFPKVKNILESLSEAYAWVTFDDVGYLHGDWSTPSRPGFHRDALIDNAWDRRMMFQFHRLPDGWWRGSVSGWKERLFGLQSRLVTKLRLGLQPWTYPKIPMSSEYQDLLDLPSGPVRCHSPWSHFNLIQTEVLNRIGQCENWYTYNPLLVDEDWGLRALMLRYWNVFIPSIQYLHVRLNVPGGGNRSQAQVAADARRVNALFVEKWKFSLNPTPTQLERVEAEHKDNYIPWSIGRNSYDWDYMELR